MREKTAGSIRNQILRYSILLALVPITILSVISYYASFQIISNLAVDAVENQVDRVNAQMDNLSEGIERLGWMVAEDSVLQAVLRQPLPQDNSARYAQTMGQNFNLMFIKEYQEDVHSLCVVGENGALFKSSLTSELDENFQSTDWYRRVLESEQPVWFEPHNGSFVIQSIGQPMIAVGLPIVDKLSGSRLGVVIIDIEAQRFVELYETELMRDGKLLLLDSENHPIIYPGMDVGLDSIPREQQEENRRNAELYADLTRRAGVGRERYTGKVLSAEGEHYLIVSIPAKVEDWKLVGVMPNSSLLRDSFNIAAVIGVSMCVVSLFIMLIAGRVSTRIVKPLQRVSDSMKLVEHGDFSPRVPPGGDDEVGRLGRSFNSMLDEINILMEKERDDQKKLRKAEYRALQAQINPHFLYNTLDSISWLARMGDMERVCEMVDALTNFFRSGLSRGKDCITIKEELCHAQNYLCIQKIRYESKLEYTIDVPSELEQYMIAKLVLQPLVENSIYHGIKTQKGRGIIEIGGKEEGEHILLWVSDTGAGMSRQRLEALNNAIARGENTTEVDSYGIVNIQKRINIYFGAEYGLRYDSVEGVGTTAYLRIPKKLEM